MSHEFRYLQDQSHEMFTNCVIRDTVARIERRPDELFVVCLTHEHFYAAGDVVSALGQISVAVGHAAVAAATVHNTLLTDSA